MKKKTPRPGTKAWARVMLKALKRLRGKYKKNILGSAYASCPLCLVCGVKDDYSRDGCRYCPWVIFTRQSCQRSHYNRIPIPKRLPRVRGWIKRCENIINKPMKRRTA